MSIYWYSRSLTNTINTYQSKRSKFVGVCCSWCTNILSWLSLVGYWLNPPFSKHPHPPQIEVTYPMRSHRRCLYIVMHILMKVIWKWFVYLLQYETPDLDYTSYIYVSTSRPCLHTFGFRHSYIFCCFY